MSVVVRVMEDMLQSRIDAETVLRLAQANNLPISRADAEAVAPRLDHLLAGVSTLDALPLEGVLPAPVLDARWEKDA